MTLKEVNALIGAIEVPANKEIISCNYPWEDVFESMRKQPEDVVRVDEKCPDCGGNLVELYFRSPDWTWRELMGRAGKMTICPKCPSQHGFQCHIMN